MPGMPALCALFSSRALRGTLDSGKPSTVGEVSGEPLAYLGSFLLAFPISLDLTEPHRVWLVLTSYSELLLGFPCHPRSLMHSLCGRE